jgi:branched-chain amino acid transport system permease protein
MEEKKEKQDTSLESLKIKRSITKPIKKYSQKLKKKSRLFVTVQLPAAQSNFKSWVTSFRGGIMLICLILVTLIPLLLNRDLYYRTFLLAMVYAIYAASWDLLAGITGQVSFGHAAFFGIGGYACAAFVKFFQFHWFVSLIIGGIFAVVFGLIIAVPSLRFKGPYLALGTLAFSLLLLQLFSMNSLKDIFFGENGIHTILVFILIDSKESFVYVLLIMIVSIVILLAISNSKVGTIFKAIRDDETSTEASGINVTKYKILAFMISSFFAGLAGGIYVLDQTKVDPFIYLPTLSFYPVIMTCLGGIALISGAVFGAYFFAVMIQILKEITDTFLPAEISNIFTNLSVFIFALILLVVVRFTERGLMEPAIERTRSLYEMILGK